MSSIRKPVFRAATALLSLAVVFGPAAAQSPMTLEAQKSQLKIDKDNTIAAPNGTMIKLPQCYDDRGVKVRYRLQDGKTLQQEFEIAYSFRQHFGGAIILLDTNTIVAEPKVTAFFVEHECAHHQQHFKVIQEWAKMHMPVSQQDKYQFELEADCAAVPEVQRKYGYTAEDLREIFSKIPANESSRLHPPTSSRLENALKCMVPDPAKGFQ